MKNKIKTLQIDNKLLIMNGKDPLRYVDLETNKLYQYPDGQLANEVVLEPKSPIDDKKQTLDRIANAIRTDNYEYTSKNSIRTHPTGIIDTGKGETNIKYIEVNWKVYKWKAYR